MQTWKCQNAIFFNYANLVYFSCSFIKKSPFLCRGAPLFVNLFISFYLLVYLSCFRLVRLWKFANIAMVTVATGLPVAMAAVAFIYTFSLLIFTWFFTLLFFYFIMNKFLLITIVCYYYVIINIVHVVMVLIFVVVLCHMFCLFHYFFVLSFTATFLVE